MSQIETGVFISIVQFYYTGDWTQTSETTWEQLNPVFEPPRTLDLFGIPWQINWDERKISRHADGEWEHIGFTFDKGLVMHLDNPVKLGGRSPAGKERK